jgi:hypothetical protein
MKPSVLSHLQERSPTPIIADTAGAPLECAANGGAFASNSGHVRNQSGVTAAALHDGPPGLLSPFYIPHSPFPGVVISNAGV